MKYLPPPRKTQLKFFPRFSQIFSAPHANLLQKITLWTILTVFLGINIYNKTQTNPTNIQKKIAVLFRPYSYDVHNELAFDYYTRGLRELAETELHIAMQYERSQDTKNQTAVLGASSSAEKLLTKWRQEPGEWEHQLSFWTQQSKLKPNYRDAYIQAATFAYKLENYSLAQEFLNRAYEVDPHAPHVKEMVEWIMKGK